MFALQNAGDDPWSLPDASIEPIGVGSDVEKFDLTLFAWESGDDFEGSLSYSTDLFDRRTAERMVGHFQTLLAAAVAAPNTRLSKLDMLTSAERHQVLVEWNDTAVEFSDGLCVHELFEQQAVLSPNATAVSFGTLNLTYRELNERANVLAHRLRDLGVGPDVLVGLCVERGLEMIVGLMAILKAGGAFVPLDSEHPKERLETILRDTAAPVVVTQEHLGDRISSNGAQLLFSDTDFRSSTRATDNLPRVAQASDLAYILYTSGSTGRPKGVAVAIRSLVNLLETMRSELSVSPSDRFLASTTMIFDISYVEIFLPLVCGAHVVVAAKDQVKSPSELARLIIERQVTVAQATPSAWRMLVQEFTGPVPNLRILVGGEALAPDLASKMVAITERVINGYGPTEATIYATTAEITDEGVVCIGRPVANTEVYVLDRYRKPVPIGVPGELFIGGIGVAKGYLNQFELTTERFVVNPFAPDSSARVYRTGDLVRWMPDGNLEFLGRADHQVKVRGFRIELGEIEAALLAHADVASCVVVAREDTPGDKRLVAYCVPEEGVEEPAVDVLRAWCARTLPDYMIPGRFVFLSILPITSNGKVNRRALPAPENIRPKLPDEFVAPRTEIEGTIASVWREVLTLDRIGIHDNFFSLGGDSILGIQMIAKLRKRGVYVTPRMIFQHQTLGLIASAAHGAIAPQAEQDSIEGESPLTPIQHWFAERDLEEAHHYNQAMLLETSNMDPMLVADAVSAVADHHDVLGSNFQTQGTTWTQQFGAAETVASCEHHDLSHLPIEQGTRALSDIADRIQKSLDLSRGPLMRVALIDLDAERRQRLLLIAHHLVIDGVSWRILLEDLGTAYEQLAAGKPVVLPPKTTSFKTWSLRLQTYARSETAQQELEYWLRKRPSAAIPRDMTGDNTEASAATIAVELTESETALLLKNVPATFGTQINDVLVAALANVMKEWTGTDATVLDLEGHGREDLFADVDLSRTVGWFTSLFPLSITLPAGASLTSSLGHVRRQLSEIPHRGVGYGILRYLGHPRAQQALRAVPDPEISFNYHGRFDSSVDGVGTYGNSTSAMGKMRSARGQRSHVLDFILGVTRKRLLIEVTYSQNIHRQETIQAIADRYLSSLREVIRQASNTSALAAAPGTPAEETRGARFSIVGSVDKSSDSRVSLVELNQGRTGSPKLFCIHEIGGNVTGYVPLAEALNPRVSVYGIESRAVSFGSEPDDDIPMMAERYWHTIRMTQPVGPYLLAGWSFGGTLSSEIARLIEAEGQSVDLLIAFDSYLPTREMAQLLARERAVLEEIHGQLTAEANSARTTWSAHWLQQRLQELNLHENLATMGSEELRNSLAVMRAHTRAIADYVPQRINCKVLLYEASESDNVIKLAESWAPFAADLIVKQCAGSHQTLLSKLHIDELAQSVSEAIISVNRQQ
ncbi:non-ribosomal peptide synthetase [Streptomyces rhizosphaericus]|nr:non-ribosomal peptide synthetase [Streptomyces rhizosphaericus]